MPIIRAYNCTTIDICTDFVYLMPYCTDIYSSNRFENKTKNFWNMSMEKILNHFMKCNKFSTMCDNAKIKRDEKEMEEEVKRERERESEKNTHMKWNVDKI